MPEQAHHTGLTIPAPARTGPSFFKFELNQLLLPLVIIVVLWLLVIPVVMLIASSLRTGPPSLPGPWTLRNFAVAFSSEFFFRSLLNTFIVSSGATAAAVGLAIVFAWLIERTDMPFRGAAWVACCCRW
jgi:iron(III) transport system permease protein